MGEHLRYAVVDGPLGTATVALPKEQTLALRIKAIHAHGFWCSRVAGGCGGRLEVAAGPIRVPYYRHQRGQAADCVLDRNPGAAERPYRHMAAQRALMAWLRMQGHDPRLEYPIPGGRADVHVVVDRASVSLEVQFSAISHNDWRRRDEVYRAHLDNVTWLYGEGLETRATEHLLANGVAFHIDVDEDLTVALGTRNIDGSVHFVPLGACRLTPDGLWTPDASSALDGTRRWQALMDIRDALGKEAARRRELLSREAQARRDAEAARRRLAGSQQVPPMPIAAVPRRGLPSAKRYLWTEAARAALMSERDGWTPPSGWGWLDSLPGELQSSAQLLAYLVCRIYESGPIQQLAFEDVPDPNARQVDALVQAGLITLYDVQGVPRWRRAT